MFFTSQEADSLTGVARDPLPEPSDPSPSNWTSLADVLFSFSWDCRSRRLSSFSEGLRSPPAESSVTIRIVGSPTVAASTRNGSARKGERRRHQLSCLWCAFSVNHSLMACGGNRHRFPRSARVWREPHSEEVASLPGGGPSGYSSGSQAGSPCHLPGASWRGRDDRVGDVGVATRPANPQTRKPANPQTGKPANPQTRKRPSVSSALRRFKRSVVCHRDAKSFRTR